MASDPKEIFQYLISTGGPPKIAQPDKGIDDLVQEIFDQAHEHRSLLLNFYIWYTSVLSGLVMFLIFAQAGARWFVYGDSKIELIPQWALNLIVIGMFGQFIGLLTIVTKKVWEFKPFLDHAKNEPANKKRTK